MEKPAERFGMEDAHFITTTNDDVAPDGVGFFSVLTSNAESPGGNSSDEDDNEEDDNDVAFLPDGTINGILNRVKARENLLKIVEKQGSSHFRSSQFMLSLPAVLCLLSEDRDNETTVRGLADTYNLDICEIVEDADSIFVSTIEHLNRVQIDKSTIGEKYFLTLFLLGFSDVLLHLHA